jgi:hypothetical protein
MLEQRAFIDVLRTFLGKVVTIVNPESYEDAPLGHNIRKGWYPARAVGLGQDYLILVTEYKHKHKPDGHVAGAEPVKQYIPVHRIKRVSVMQQELLIHL